MDMLAQVRLSLDEDLGPGDLTTEACIPADAVGEGVILAKQALVVAGHVPAGLVFQELGQRTGGLVRYEPVILDGELAHDRQLIAKLSGNLRTLISGERLALNFLMKLSGIATHVRPYVDAAQGKLRVVDTRKTTPMLRALEKYAVRCGGAHNHRFALYDGMMVKDNHIQAAGSLREAVAACKAHAHHLVRVEVEVERLDQLAEALDTQADVILLDNMDDATMAECVRLTRERRPGVILEASGNITPERIAAIRDLGLDVVSAGGLIHQARWVDLSLRLRG